MDLKLKGKTALVTGSTAGIGFAIAQILAQEGATVVINGRTKDRVNEAMQQIKVHNPEAILIAAPADLSQKSETEALIKQIPTVEILVNNAGIYNTKPFVDISDEEWLHMFEVNVMSGVRLSRHYITPMLKQNWGRIIFISSESAVQIPKEMVHYGMSKTAQLAIARGMAETTKGTNVTVNSVLPGPTSSEGISQFVSDLGKQQNKSTKQIEKDIFDDLRPTSLIKRFSTPEEIANMVVFLCSPLSSATNGASIRVDGGIIRTIA
ncbi:SDR family oxidoreductase [Fluoribacter gormanii]|uniref:3-oxoacyl-[acyl-carrier-protein] reductase FabG n=1 Tax=Fluoribacter gormanii TaxID=464 RepID=A0A377GJ48_9GAMM|nr:SDR family oxidoreductase [Fluoribacter gormanii]KTD01388.1 short-chain dehydrogenase/reductase [Fluoribacter gormanii]MCW8443583.1 SDR family oxidoreductase [Fluoribacter gormanii]MCW8472009.1 SDR family oxidoreductase [Fluoribacter gormanii]SIR47541.1 NAD(P)-dependent dehydrogenase, short-chain alcohol dehydrogenase family [Fluoribacter gormanii]STO24870.1 3-oxoacyl-[acyl-carrier-protein] reductase FabG [Fluoribacter gormanii]